MLKDVFKLTGKDINVSSMQIEAALKVFNKDSDGKISK